MLTQPRVSSEYSIIVRDYDIRVREFSRTVFAISFCRSNSARLRAISSGDSQAILEKSNFQPGSSLQRSGDCAIVRDSGAASSTLRATQG